MRAALSAAVVSAVFLTSAAVPPVAEARLSDTYRYRYDQLWRAAVRLIAVDYRFPIRDRDEEIGYVLFDYEDRGRTFEGSLELVRLQEDGRAPQVRVVIHVNRMPTYVERMLLDRLTRKLGEDYGAPPSLRPTPEPEPPAVDDDDDDDEDGEGDEPTS